MPYGLLIMGHRDAHLATGLSVATSSSTDTLYGEEYTSATALPVGRGFDIWDTDEMIPLHLVDGTPYALFD